MADNSILFHNGQLSYINCDCEQIPVHLAAQYGSVASRIDLSYNRIECLEGLEQFVQLEEVILDSNCITDDSFATLPLLPKVHTLSINKNLLRDLDRVIGVIKTRLPSLTYISLLGNEACPDQLSSQDKDEDDYQRYRLYMLYNLPNLRFLDFAQYKDADRVEAKQKGAFLKVVRPSNDIFTDVHGDVDSGASSEYKPLPSGLREEPTMKATFAKCKYVYHGRHSEGNRFILNNDL